MTIYNYFYDIGCLTREDVLRLAKNHKNADSIIYTQKKSGSIQSVKRNLYVTISRETKTPVASPFEIASKITDGAFISHHSAFEYYGIANQFYLDVNVSSPTRFNDFEFDGKKYVYVSTKVDFGVVTVKNNIRITDIERTILDSIKDFTKIGGLEELLRCLSMVAFIDETKMLNYLTLYDNQFLYQKTGYILSHLQDSMKISDAFFLKCRKKINKSIRYLYDEIKYEKSMFYSDWQILAPVNLMKMIDEGGDVIV